MRLRVGKLCRSAGASGFHGFERSFEAFKLSKAGNSLMAIAPGRIGHWRRRSIARSERIVASALSLQWRKQGRGREQPCNQILIESLPVRRCIDPS